ncbi:hypothetical protein IJJ97_05925 [bacterium]|nr:hypothetical protein [bacterium]
MSEEDKNWKPTFENHIFPDEKMSKYALDKTSEKGKNKAIVFEKVLGYNLENRKELEKQIKEKLSVDNLVEEEPNKYGRRFICDLEITGVNCRMATVRTTWIKDNGEFFLKLTSLYVK